MSDNVYKFCQTKRADPKRFQLIADFEPKRSGSRYFSGFVVLSVLIGFVAVQAWPKLKPEIFRSGSTPAAFSVRVIDGDTISLEDGKPNVRLVGFNAPETGSRARMRSGAPKG